MCVGYTTAAAKQMFLDKKDTQTAKKPAGLGASEPTRALSLIHLGLQYITARPTKMCVVTQPCCTEIYADIGFKLV